MRDTDPKDDMDERGRALEARVRAEWVANARAGSCLYCAHEVVAKVYADLGVDSIRVVEALEAELSARLVAECESLVSEWHRRVAAGLSPCTESPDRGNRGGAE